MLLLVQIWMSSAIHQYVIPIPNDEQNIYFDFFLQQFTEKYFLQFIIATYLLDTQKRRWKFNKK